METIIETNIISHLFVNYNSIQNSQPITYFTINNISQSDNKPDYSYNTTPGYKQHPDYNHHSNYITTCNNCDPVINDFTTN